MIVIIKFSFIRVCEIVFCISIDGIWVIIISFEWIFVDIWKKCIKKNK